MMGVAQPGVAPLHPGQEAAPAPTQGDSEPPDPELEEVAPYRIPTGALVLVGVCAVLIFGAVVFAIFYNSPKALSASVYIDEGGGETLKITCSNCPDETKAILGEGSTTLTSGSGELKLSQPLVIGTNVFAIALERPGMGRDEEVRVLVPVHYRVRADYSALSEGKSELGVVVHTQPGATVEIDGEAIEIDGEGVGRYAIEIGDKLKGMDAAARPLHDTVQYTITLSEAAVFTGRLQLRTMITPLWLESPGPSTIIDGDRFLLAGVVGKGGTVSVEGTDITLNAEGRFEQMMSVDAVGETTITVRAQMPDHAPRWLPVRIKRVDSLRKEAEIFRQTATDQYGRYGQNVANKIGLAVVADGVVEHSRIEHHSTSILLDVHNGCLEGPCLARLIVGGKLELAPRAEVSAFGRISRAVEGVRKGTMVPEIRVEFLLPK
jgi:hypothetical protein